MSNALNIIPRAGNLKLYVIAGFPKGTAPAILKRLQDYFPSANMQFLGLPFGTGGAGLYGQGAVEALLRSVAEFAIRRRVNSERANRPAVPGRLILLYVPAPDEENLLTVFDFFCLPVPLKGPRCDSHRPDGWRLDPEVAANVVRDAIRELETGDRPAPNLPRNAVITLPPDNFRPERNAQTLAECLIEFRQGKLNMEEIEKAVEIKKFNNDELPNVLKGKKKSYFYVDYRGIVFPPADAETGDHGPARELSEDPNVNSIKIRMNQLYRRGTPLHPGFHHDAQYPNGREMNEDQFCCREHGDVLVSGTHANIYPNDVIRAANIKMLKR